jgi:endonuclease/exonuclease/phosphatase family metal-dependent hydrolase
MIAAPTTVKTHHVQLHLEIRCHVRAAARHVSEAFDLISNKASVLMQPRLLLLGLALLLSQPVLATELKVATWNLDWLTTRAAGDPGLPADVKPRSEDDFGRLAQYAQEMNADVVAIEEVDGFSAASKVFPRDRYSIHMTRDHVMQRVGIAVRRGLHYDINPDVTALGANHLRSGADITLHVGASDLRVLAVHLKRGCQDTPLQKAKSRVCQELRDQISPLTDWITARRQEGIAFVILGDFNRRMDGADKFIAELRKAGPLVRATEGRSSPCWGNENFIDHILAGGTATDWMRADTLRVLSYRETDPVWKDRLSDHCPVSVRFTVPD